MASSIAAAAAHDSDEDGDDGNHDYADGDVNAYDDEHYYEKGMRLRNEVKWQLPLLLLPALMLIICTNIVLNLTLLHQQKI